MKKFLATAAFFCVLAVPLLSSGANIVSSQGKSERMPERVPKGLTYVTYNKKGEETGRYKSGEATPEKRRYCVWIKCREGLDNGFRCWRCNEE